MLDKNLSKHIRIWQVYSVLAPAIFLAISGVLTFFFGAPFEILFWIGVVIFGVTCVAWWHWSLATMLEMLNIIKEADAHYEVLTAQLAKLSNQKTLQ